MIPLLNTQTKEKQDHGTGLILDVVEVFETIQGEGPYAGTPSVFVRMAGCNLDCKFCDTLYTTGRRKFHIDHLYDQIKEKMPKRSNLVVFTGGEPLRQNLIPILDMLLVNGYVVQIETNGTLYLDMFNHLKETNPNDLTTVCSPKTGAINSALMPYIDALKYIVESGKVDPEDGLPLDSLGAGVRVVRPWEGFKGQVYVQPLDEQDESKNKLHLKEAVKSCMDHGYRLSIQTHKLAGVP